MLPNSFPSSNWHWPLPDIGAYKVAFCSILDKLWSHPPVIVFFRSLTIHAFLNVHKCDNELLHTIDPWMPEHTWKWWATSIGMYSVLQTSSLYLRSSSSLLQCRWSYKFCCFWPTEQWCCLSTSLVPRISLPTSLKVTCSWDSLYRNHMTVLVMVSDKWWYPPAHHGGFWSAVDIQGMHTHLPGIVLNQMLKVHAIDLYHWELELLWRLVWWHSTRRWQPFSTKMLAVTLSGSGSIR